MIMCLAQFADPQIVSHCHLPSNSGLQIIKVSLLVKTSLLKAQALFYFYFKVRSTWGPPIDDAPEESQTARVPNRS